MATCDSSMLCLIPVFPALALTDSLLVYLMASKAEQYNLTDFQEGFQFQGPEHRLLLQAPVGLRDALHLHFGALKGLVGAVLVLDKAACYFQGHLGRGAKNGDKQ